MKPTTANPMVTFDLRMSLIPFALLEICNHFRKMKPGEVIEIHCDETTIERDLRCILPKGQYETMCLEAPAPRGGGRVIRLRKVGEPAQTPPCDRLFHETLPSK
jgi:TusA-related sulfurtransferase